MTIANAIIGNLVGDYLLQNDWMAIGKKKSSFVCAVHCAIWTACVCLFAGWYHPIVIAILFAEHFLQDRTQNWHLCSVVGNLRRQCMAHRDHFGSRSIHCRSDLNGSEPA